ncbi:helix-turn-helix domain-containing protein [Floricoccus penangensis]|uniref:helix-turn-helix domain-containing protein n=1 Tax=Floricoccus penangensis TaxID=1859475 RepID=UPI0020415A06|nr:helix-turn-helix transcriptional regulator [Floricoccus penangensis]URZ87354.1 helix-turn-helix domain-containing protein [Floricoccus penangensis]
MDIGNQIKEKRREKGWTQEELGRKLNVTRAAVSNWEASRNYPDIKTIVDISDILSISLDKLLKGDTEMVDKIVKDNKKIRKERLIFFILTFVLFFILLIITFDRYKNIELSNSNQIKQVEIDGDNLQINTNLPLYRSLTGYFINNNRYHEDTIQIELTSSMDFSLKHQEKMNIELQNNLSKKVKYVEIINSKGEVFETVETNKHIE